MNQHQATLCLILLSFFNFKCFLFVLSPLFFLHAESYIPVPAQLGGDATFNIDGALASQCKTYDGRLVVECLDGTTMVGIGLEFQNRISG